MRSSLTTKGIIDPSDILHSFRDGYYAETLDYEVGPCISHSLCAEFFLDCHSILRVTVTHMVAQQCNLGVGDFIWTGGDYHLYSNDLEQANYN
jgi:hypothetical protein